MSAASALRDHPGVTPKVLERMLRFRRLLASLQLGLACGENLAGTRLAAPAAAGGYAGESHLNRECRRLIGLSIGTYLDEVNRMCGCGHDHGASIAHLRGP